MAEIIVMKDNFIDFAATLLNSVVMTMFHTKGIFFYIIIKAH